MEWVGRLLRLKAAFTRLMSWPHLTRIPPLQHHSHQPYPLLLHLTMPEGWMYCGFLCIIRMGIKTKRFRAKKEAVWRGKPDYLHLLIY